MEQHSLDAESSRSLRSIQWLVGAINALILLPPILFELGAVKISSYLYTALGFLCHQRADRSFYLFGEQLLYPKEFIWDKVPLNQLFTFDFRQRFTCNEELGCRFGVCARCTGMYLGLLFGLVLSEFILWIKIPKIIPLLLLVPLIVDGSIQTIAYIISPERGFYESTNPRRFVTGLLFGLGVGYLMVSAIKPAIAKNK